MATLKQGWAELREGRPGHRFQDRYKRKKTTGKNQPWARRFLEPVIGIVLVVAGIVFCVIPGPGIPLILLGVALLAERSLPMSRALDWLEINLRRLFKKGVHWWHRASWPARIGAAFVAACLAAGMAFIAYRVLVLPLFT